MSPMDVVSIRSSLNGLIGSAMNRAVTTLQTKEELQSRVERPDQGTEKDSKGLDYSGNPCVQFTSLAHVQWKYILRPGLDSAIDATCGNGNDSCQIARMLFPDGLSGESELVCIDIQDKACQNTRKALEAHFGTPLMEPRVRILNTSHAKLPTTSSPLSLVCWNLGYLPKSLDKSTHTKMQTTIDSIADAALQIRVGGLLSAITYPMTNANEAFAVKEIFNALAVVSSTQIDWRSYLATIGPDPIHEGDELFSVKEKVNAAMHRIMEEGDSQQTWRAMEHQMLGRSGSPILLTLTRIK